MEYLNNNICKFEIITPFDVTVKKNLFVTSLFRLSTGGYKDFQIYVDGIGVLNNVANKENMYVRLFIDRTIESDNDLMTKLQKYNRVQLVLYKCSDFIIDTHHVGLIGTLIRFFPMFDFQNNDAGTVIVCDADSTYKIVQRPVKFLHELREDNIFNDLYFGYYGQYHLHSNKKLVHNNQYTANVNQTYIFPYCMAASLIGIKKIPPESLTKYFSKLRRYMHNPPNEILSNHYIAPEKYKILCENNICYGVDEYYINEFLLKYLLVNNMAFCYKYKFNIYETYYYHISHEHKWVMGGQKMSDKQYERIFKDYMKSAGLNKYNSKELDKKLYVVTNGFEKATEFMLEFKNKIIPFLKKLYEKNDYRLYSPALFYMLFTNDYDKYFSAEQIRFININHEPTILNAVEY